jgi:hypothetical protein
MVPPQHFVVEYAINPWMGGTVDKAKAMKQWTDLKQALTDNGVKVGFMRISRLHLSLGNVNRSSERSSRHGVRMQFWSICSWQEGVFYFDVSPTFLFYRSIFPTSVIPNDKVNVHSTRNGSSRMATNCSDQNRMDTSRVAVIVCSVMRIRYSVAMDIVHPKRFVCFSIFDCEQLLFSGVQ